MRRLLFLVLTSLLLPEMAGADNVATTLDGFRYELNIDKNKGTAEITDVSREQKDKKALSIPASFEYEGTNFLVTSIKNYGCVNAGDITSLAIPNSVTYIGQNAFDHLEQLATVSLGSSIMTIDSYAFSNCKSLTAIELPESLVKLGNAVFNSCSELTALFIPKNVSSISSGVNNLVPGCSKLESIVVDERNTTYDSRNGCNAIISKQYNTLITGCKTTVIPESVTTIAGGAFRVSSISSIEIPNSVTTIGDNAFYGCTLLTSVTLPDKLEKIQYGVFYGCKKLASVHIPNSVQFIEKYAFRGCRSLSTINIPSSVMSIAEGAFYGCSGLTSISLPDNLSDIRIYTFRDCSSLPSLTIPASVQTIQGSAFYGCTSLTSLIMTSWNPEAITLTSANYITNHANITLYVPQGTKARYEEKWGGVFKEIAETAPAEDSVEDAVKYLQQKKVIDGTTLADALPDDPLLRAHIAKMAFRGVYSTGSNQVPEVVISDFFPTIYEDLGTKTEANDYYYQAAKALLYLDYGDGVTPFDHNRLNFSPMEGIARVHVLKVLMETFNLQPDLTGTTNPFPQDADVEALAARDALMMGYIRQAVRLGIVTTANDTFRPTANCTRGEAFLMLYRIMRAVDEGRIIAPAPTIADYFEPLNTTLFTIGLGTGLPMGNFQHYTKTSFAISGTVPLAFSHTYSSYNTTLPEVLYGARATDGNGDTYQPLGDGWSHNYHSFISMSGTGDSRRAIVHWGGGSIDVYKAKGEQMVPVSLGVYDSFTFDGDDAVIKTKNQMTYRFSQSGGTDDALYLLSTITDRNGNTLTLNYEQGVNDAMRISSVTDGHRSISFGYKQGTNLLESVCDPLQRSIGFSYSMNKATGRYQLSSFVDAKGQMTTYLYGDASKAATSKLLSRIQLPKGNYIENQYDANRRLTKTVSGADNVPTTETSISVTTQYASGTPSTQSAMTVKRTSNTSATYSYTFDENNSVTAMTGENGLFANITYGDNTHPQLPTSAKTNTTEVSDAKYDAKGNLTSITIKGDGTQTTSMTYDTMNNLTSVTDPKGNTTTYTYDSKGNLKKVSAPEDVSWTIAVDSKGLPTEVQDPMGVKTEYEYNDYGNLVKTTLPALGLSGTATYDAASRLLSTTDALNRTQQFAYDQNDNLTCSTDPAGNETQYTFDQNDNLTTITNAKGGVTTLTYDNTTDWLTSVTFAEATKEYSYNNDGLLSVYIKPDGTKRIYSYDKLGHVTYDGMYSYSYDDKQRLSSIAGGGKRITFGYDGFNRITATSFDGHSNSYTYDDNGNCTSVNGTTYTYDGLDRVTAVKFSGKTISYTYRKDSKLSKVEYPNGMTTTYSYDNVGRLTSKTTKLGNGTVVAGYTYTLDSIGNIVEQTAQEPYDEMVAADEDVSYTYNSGNRITKAGDVSFEFDANGNTTKRGDETYQWDKLDHLTKAGSSSLTYDPLGLIASYGDITFTTDPLGMGNVLSDSRSGAEYIYGNSLEARVKDGKVSYYVADLRGSVIAIVDDNGNITHKYQYDEFGKVIQKEEADYNPFQYVGKYGVMCLNDHQYYMRARHYDPTIGRFLSEDPIWSTNLYPYADNNPVMGIDPRGTLEVMSTGYEIYQGIKTVTSVGTQYGMSTATKTYIATEVAKDQAAADALIAGWGSSSSSVAATTTTTTATTTSSTAASTISTATTSAGGMSAGATIGAVGCGVGIIATVVVLAQDGYKAVQNAKHSDGFVDFIDRQNENGGWLYKGAQKVGDGLDSMWDAVLGP